MHLLDVLDQICVKNILPEGAVKPLDVSVLHGYVSLDELVFNLIHFTPFLELHTDKFRAFVRTNHLWLALVPDRLLQNLKYLMTGFELV